MAEDDRAISSDTVSSRLVASAFKAAGTSIADPTMYIILGGVLEFFTNNCAIWSLYKDYVDKLNIDIGDVRDPEHQGRVAAQLGNEFQALMDANGISTYELDDDHFIYIGCFTGLMATYPRVFANIAPMIDGACSSGATLAQMKVN